MIVKNIKKLKKSIKQKSKNIINKKLIQAKLVEQYNETTNNYKIAYVDKLLEQKLQLTTNQKQTTHNKKQTTHNKKQTTHNKKNKQKKSFYAKKKFNDKCQYTTSDVNKEIQNYLDKEEKNNKNEYNKSFKKNLTSNSNYNLCIRNIKSFRYSLIMYLLIGTLVGIISIAFLNYNYSFISKVQFAIFITVGGPKKKK